MKLKNMKLTKILISALMAVSILMVCAVPVKADHSHCYDFWGRCSCGHYCMESDHSRWGYGYCGYGYGCPYYGYPCYVGYPVAYVPVAVAVPTTISAPVPVTAPSVPVVAALPIVSTAVTMTNGLAVAPVSCTISNPKDAANQVAVANATATLLGKKTVKIGNSFNLDAGSGYKAAGVPQTIRFPLAASGLTDKTNLSVVYWNSSESTRTLPVVVDSLGYATFTVPNMTGTTIITLFSCK